MVRITGANVKLVINTVAYSVKGSCDINFTPNAVDSTASGDVIDQIELIRAKGMITATLVSIDRALLGLIASAVSVSVLDGATTFVSTIAAKVLSANHSNPHDGIATFAVEVAALEIPSQFDGIEAL